MLLVCIQKASSQISGRALTSMFLIFPLNPSACMLWWCLKLVYWHFLLHSFQFIAHYAPIKWHEALLIISLNKVENTVLPQGFWRWCVTLITTKLLDFVHRPDFFCSGIACGKASFWFFCRVGAPAHLKTETDPVSETLCFLFVEIRTMDKVQKLSSNGCVICVHQLL
jgi:hypothetical protein